MSGIAIVKRILSLFIHSKYLPSLYCALGALLYSAGLNAQGDGYSVSAPNSIGAYQVSWYSPNSYIKVTESKQGVSGETQLNSILADRGTIPVTRTSGVYTYKFWRCGSSGSSCNLWGSGTATVSVASSSSSSVSVAPPVGVTPAPAPAIPSSTIPVGSMAGGFKVSESGSATYSIPIAVAPGVAGVAPQLAITYESQGGNGLVGVGANINGMGSIVRCQQTLLHDGAVRPLAWNENDRFCLNGQRLMLVTGTYGYSGSIYRTEIDSFAQVTAFGGAAGNPDYFEVEAKDGSISTYGGTTDSRLQGAKIITWGLSRFKDSVGNQINYVYEGDRTDGHRIKTINYAYPVANSDSSPSASVEFSYVTRTDVSSSYAGGFSFKNIKRLVNITTKNGTAVYRKYYFNYNENGSSGVDNLSRLTSAQECLSDSLTSCYPKTAFAWGSKSVKFGPETSWFGFLPAAEQFITYRFMDMNADGRQELVWVRDDGYSRFIEYAGFDRETRKVIKKTFTNEAQFIRYYTRKELLLEAIDYNADGRQDLMVWVELTEGSLSGRWNLYLSVPDNDGKWQLSTTPIEMPFTNRNIRFGDIDADGLLDVVDLSATNFAAVYPLKRRVNGDPGSNTYYTFPGSPTPKSLIGAPVFQPTGQQTETWGYEHTRLSDFDGDGRLDIAVPVKRHYYPTSCNPGLCDPQTLDMYIFINTGTSFTYSSTFSKRVFETAITGTSLLRLLDIVPSDLNTDGLVDLVIRSDKSWIYLINEGNGLGASSSITFTQAPMDTPESIQVTDINSDGYSDILWHDKKNKQLKWRQWDMENARMGTADTVIINRIHVKIPRVGIDEIVDVSTIASKNNFYQFADINGDGFLDQVIQKLDGDNNVDIGVISGLQEGSRLNYIYEITDGNQRKTKITYSPLSDSKHYTTLDGIRPTSVDPYYCSNWTYPVPCTPPAVSLPDVSSLYTQLNRPFGLTFEIENPAPVLESPVPMFAVTEVSESAPTSSNPANTNRVSYHYHHARIQAGGRGYLGFEKLTTIDMQTGVKTETTYYQDFPFTGSPKFTVVKTKEGHKLSEATNVMVAEQNTINSRIKRVYLDVSTEVSYGLKNNGALQGATLQTITTNTDYDDEGNATFIQATTSGSANTSIKTITNSFSSDTWEKRMGRVLSTITTTQRNSDPAITRKASFEYYGRYETWSGMLKTEIIEPGGNQLKTEHRYDGVGNKTETIKTAKVKPGNSQTRKTIVEYDPSKRFVQTTKDSLNNVTSGVVTYDQFYGLPTKIRDANGVETVINYNRQGMEVQRSNATGAWAHTNRDYCGPNIPCPSGAYYRVENLVSGGGKATEYTDVLGRVIRTSKVLFDGRESHVDTEYDNLGRVVRSSTPYTSGQTPYWTIYEYDILNRATKVTTPDDTVSTTTYDGYKTTVIADVNGKALKREEERNSLGHLVKVTDNMQGTITYGYDALGNLTSATTVASGKTVKVQMCYDNLGRKFAMHDPDKGGFLGNSTATCDVVDDYINSPPSGILSGWWMYRYNDFGELIEQVDTKKQSTVMDYDALGRMITRTDKFANGAVDAHTRWYYDKNIGEAVVQPKNQLKLMAVVTSYGSVNESCSGSNYCQTYFYDGASRLTDTTTYLPNHSVGYINSVKYDTIGRVYETRDVLNSIVGNSGTLTLFNAYGYAGEIRDLASGDVLQKTIRVNGRGQITEEWRNNGGAGVATYQYDDKTGEMLNQKASIASGLFPIQDVTYKWDKLGNLESRWNQSSNVGRTAKKNLQESFCYDGLNRLIKSYVGTLTGSCSLTAANQDVEYDGLGNITRKTGVGTYSYTGKGPHAVTSTTNDGTYIYDNNGNQTSGNGRAINYSSYDQPILISTSSVITNWSYGPDRARWQRIDRPTTSSQRTLTQYLGNVERIDLEGNNIVEWKRYIAGAIYTVRTTTVQSGGSINYTVQRTDKSFAYNDHLGSLDVVVNNVGQVTHTASFDAWGNRRNAENWTGAYVASSLALTNYTNSITRRGYTGHEMVDGTGIIHMNGRIYDPRLARFMQADPFIQAAANTQSYNRYSYVWNNPLNATDPSGYFLKGFIDLFKNGSRTFFRMLGRDASQVVVSIGSYFCGPFAGFCAAAGNYDLNRAFGASSRDAFKAGVFSGLSAAAFTGAGKVAELAGGGLIETILISGVTGGMMAVGQGGNFGHAFVTAGANVIAGGLAGEGTGGLLAAVTLMGTVSEATGGKFANGAATAAYSYTMKWAASKFKPGGKQPEPEKPAQSGASATCNPINIATGEKYLTMVDYKAEGASQMTFERHYSSYAHEKSSLGIGWRSNFDRRLEVSRVGDFVYAVAAIRHQGDAISFTWEEDETTADNGRWLADNNRFEVLRKTESGWEVQFTNNTREIYDDQGRLVKILQIDGYEQTLVYGNQGTVKNVLLSVADNFGQQLTFAYDLQSRMTRMTATDGSVTRYEYDQFDNLAKVISPDDTLDNPWDNAYVVYDYNDARFNHAITGIRNSQGQRIHSMAYDEQGRAVLSALGGDAERVDMAFSQSEDNTKHTIVKNSLGKNTSYTFDEQNKPLVVEGHPTASCIGSNQGYEYNDKDQLISKTDWNGAVTQYEYNDRGLETLRVEAVGTAQERRIATEWHNQWRLPVRVSGAGLEVEFAYNDQGQLTNRLERDITAELNALQSFFKQYPTREWSYDYNEQGLLALVDGPRTDVNDITQFEYDTKGNRVAVINALGHSSKVLAVNERGLPLQVRDANGVVTELGYNARGWLTTKTLKTEQGDTTTQYQYSGTSDYNDKGLVSSVSLPNGEEIHYEYDAARRLIAQRNKAGERIEYSLDLEGNRLEQRIYAAGNTLMHSQRQVFDELSRLLQSIGADGNSIRLGYDKAGNRISTTDALGNQTAYAYDALNRLMATTDALDGVVTQTYDTADRVTSVTDQRGLTTQYRYNGFGNKVAQISPDTGETLYGYDQAGNLTSKRDARSVVTQYRYDALGRVTDIIYPAANDDNIHYTYDDQQGGNKGIGRVAMIDDASGQQAYKYNSAGQIEEQVYQIGSTHYSVGYDYDAVGQLVAQHYPSGRSINIAYDEQGRVAQVNTSHQGKSQSVVSKLRHQPFGPLAELQYGNGAQLNIAHDQNYRFRAQYLDGVAANDSLYARIYDYDANSNIVAISDARKPTASQVFHYDALSRLTEATGSYGHIHYGYDAVGNRISREQNGKLEAYSYADTSNRLLTVVSESEQGELQARNLGYDAVGNITSDATNGVGKILQFGDNNRLEQVAIVKDAANDSTTAGYVYNAKGQRVIKRVKGKMIHFHYDIADRLLAETNENGQPIREYIYVTGQRVAMVDYSVNTAGVVYYMVNDHLGTPQLLLDVDQQVVWSVDQSPFGEVKVEGNVEQPLRFPGQYADVETGYSYNYFRDYDPTLGRYIESDPIGLEAGVNTFGYVGGSPIIYLDQYGLAYEFSSKEMAFSHAMQRSVGTVRLETYGNLSPQVSFVVRHTYDVGPRSGGTRYTYSTTHASSHSLTYDSVPTGGNMGQTRPFSHFDIVGAAVAYPQDMPMSLEQMEMDAVELSNRVGNNIEVRYKKVGHESGSYCPVPLK